MLCTNLRINLLEGNRKIQIRRRSNLVSQKQNDKQFFFSNFVSCCLLVYLPFYNDWSMTRNLSLIFLPSAYPVRRECTVFTSVSVHTRRGGGCISSPSHSTSIGTMSFLGDTPVTGSRSLSLGVPQSKVWAYPSPRWGGEHPNLGYPTSRDGAPPPPPTGDGVPSPGIGQQRDYLLSGGRYASCVHAGGFSCFFMF